MLSAGCGLSELEQIPANRLLQRRLAMDHDIGSLPEPVQPLPLVGEFWFDTVFADPIKGAPAAINQLARRHAT